MKIAMIEIGNSKGIRIPKPVIQQCHIKNSVDLIVKGDHIIITPNKEVPRVNWDKEFKSMSENKEDTLLINDSLDIGDWEWK